MTSIGEKADEASVRAVFASSDDSYPLDVVILDDELAPAREVADELGQDWPRHGEFLRAQVVTWNPEVDGYVARETMLYVECPGGLAQEIVAAGAGEGDSLRIDRRDEKEAGRWRYDVERLDGEAGDG